MFYLQCLQCYKYQMVVNIYVEIRWPSRRRNSLYNEYLVIVHTNCLLEYINFTSVHISQTSHFEDRQCHSNNACYNKVRYHTSSREG